MMKDILKKSNRCIVPFVFFGFLIYLFIAFLARFSDEDTLTRVTLASYPSDRSIKSMMDGSFQKSFEEWANDNFYLHNNSVRVHNQIVYSVFNDSVGDYIQGRDGYLFSKSQSYTYTGGDRANNATWEEYLEYAGLMASVQQALSRHGKDFEVLINPIKVEVYPDCLPWNERILAKKYGKNGDSTHNMLIRALDESGVN